MTEVTKGLAILFVALILSLIAHWIESSFISEFAANFIPLLTTLLAINIASGSLIAGKLKEISSNTNLSFEPTHSALKKGLWVQLTLIGISFFVLMLFSSKKIRIGIGEEISSVSVNTIVLGIFIYYLDTIRDLGKALFALLNHNEKN